MNLKDLATPFPAEDVEWRIQQSGISNGSPWARVLAYITARAIMARLDEIVGPSNWTVSYRLLREKGILCTLSIWDDEKGQWISKEDGAEETDIESMKGGISSALKRAGAVFGIGRYLYKLDAGFAECSKDSGKLPHYAKMKDGTAFSWKAPDLPSWALPAGVVQDTGSGQKAKNPVPGTQDKPAKARGPHMTTAQSRKIHVLIRDLGLSDDVYRGELKRSYHVTSSKDLDRDQAGALIDRMTKKLKRDTDRDVSEAFGNGGRVETLRNMCLGLTGKIKTLGNTYQDGTPIDFKKEGLVVDTLEELDAVIGEMADEKELENMAVRVEALIAVMSF